MNNYESLFRCGSRSNVGCGFEYVQGLFHECKSNIERMQERIPESNYQQLQHFISESGWSAGEVIKEVTVNGSALRRFKITFLFNECLNF